MNNNAKIIGNRINTLLAEQIKKQKDLAQFLGVKDNMVSYWASGNRIPTTEQIINIAKFFNVSTDYLLGLSDVQSTDEDVKFISKYTGLSEYAIDVLNFYKDFDMIYPTINALLETEMCSVLQELGYMHCDTPKDILKEQCRENNIDYNQLERIIETKDYQRLQIVIQLEKYLNYNDKENKSFQITESGKLLNDEEIFNSTNISDMLSIASIRQDEIVNRVLLDNIVTAFKKLKKDISQKGGD